jgi:hypothetical protein
MEEPDLRSLKEERKQCCASVYRPHSFRPGRCEKKATVEVDGKPYCGLHDPAKVQARRDANLTAFNAKFDLRQARWRIEREADNMLALLVESQTSIGGDWRERRDALILRTRGEAQASEGCGSSKPLPQVKT